MICTSALIEIVLRHVVHVSQRRHERVKTPKSIRFRLCTAVSAGIQLAHIINRSQDLVHALHVSDPRVEAGENKENPRQSHLVVAGEAGSPIVMFVFEAIEIVFRAKKVQIWPRPLRVLFYFILECPGERMPVVRDSESSRTHDRDRTYSEHSSSRPVCPRRTAGPTRKGCV